MDNYRFFFEEFHRENKLPLKNGRPRRNEGEFSDFARLLVELGIDCEFLSMDSLGEQAKEYFVLEPNGMFDEDRLAMPGAISPTSLSKLQNTDTTLLIWYPEERFEYLSQAFSQQLEQLGLAQKTIHIAGDIFEKGKYVSPLKSVHSLHMWDHYAKKALITSTPPNFEKGPFSKKFICLNNVMRTHRLLTLSLIDAKGLLPLGYVSSLNHSLRDERASLTEAIYLRAKSSTLPFQFSAEELIALVDTTVQKHVPTRSHTPAAPLKLDLAGGDFDPWAHQTNNVSLRQFYLDCYWSIVTETDFGYLLPSEKVHLPFYYLRPFALVTEPGTLAALKSKGYRSFPEFFSDEYDEWPDFFDRVNYVVERSRELADMSNNDLEAMYSEAKEDLIHNQSLFLAIDAKSRVVKLLSEL